jgi:predicted dehydrogenase
MARKLLKVGVIGANWTGILHLPAWRSLPDGEVAAICTSREETANALEALEMSGLSARSRRQMGAEEMA